MSVVPFNSNIDFSNSDLITGKIQSTDGVIHYYGFEEVRKDNFNFWYAYGQLSSYHAETCEDFCDEAQEVEPFFSYSSCGIAKAFNYTEDQWELLRSVVRKKGWKKYKSPFGFGGVRDGVNGWESVLKSSSAYRPCYVVYLSRIPVKKRHVVDVDWQTYARCKKLSKVCNYWNTFGHIVMSFVFYAKRNGPEVTHMGIFRNSLSFLNLNESYKNVSMELHGFAAAVYLSWMKNLNARKIA